MVENSCIKIFDSQTQFAFLVVCVKSPPSQIQTSVNPTPTTYVFTIDKNTGGISHFGLPNIDLFSSEDAAVNHLKGFCNFDSKQINQLGKALIGATVSGNQLVIASIMKDTRVARVLEQDIMLINEINLFYLDLNNGQQRSEPLLESFDFNNNHYYCATLDLTVPFPYPINELTQNASQTFCWNKRFLTPFEECKALPACVVVLQGAVFSFNNSSYRPNIENIVYILKRSSMNPGTRYNARGLNSSIVPANECECELIFYFNSEYYAQAWRRGSPPVGWRTEFSKIFVVNHQVDKNSSDDTPLYFQGIMSRFGIQNVHIVSLLHESGQEKEINTEYEVGINKFRDFAPNVRVVFQKFDMNAIIKENDEKTMIDRMIESFKEDVTDSNFTKTDKTGQTIYSKQRNLFRFNCADSLDRTNVSTFYYTLLLTAKFAKDVNKSFQSQEMTNWSNPSKFIREDVIDFLGNSFIECGNIVSRMYTNTEAVKTALIRKIMVKDIPQDQKSDSKIAVIRRFQNKLWDDKRQAVIEDWIGYNRDNKNPKFTLSEQYVSVCSNSVFERPIDHSIFELTENEYLISSSSKSITAMFPQPLLLYGVSLLIIPQDPSDITLTITIDEDNNTKLTYFANLSLPHFQTRTWVTYDLRKIAKNSSNFPMDPKCQMPTMFVTVKIDTSIPSFLIGNMRFIVKRPGNKSYFDIISNPPKVKGKNYFQVAEEALGLFEKRKQKFDELCNIELSRVTNMIPIFNRNEYLVKSNFNPWVFDLRSQMISQGVNNSGNFNLNLNYAGICRICGKNLQQTNNICFVPNKKYPFYYEKGGKTEAKNRVLLCTECSDRYVECNLDEYTKNLMNVDELVHLPVHQYSRHEENEIDLHKYVYPYCMPNSIDKNKLQDCFYDNSQLDINSKKVALSFCLPACAMLENMVILHDGSKEPFQCVVYSSTNLTENIARIKKQTKTQDHYELKPREPLHSFLITFTSTKPNTEMNFTLKKILLKGKFTFKPKKSSNKPKNTNTKGKFTWANKFEEAKGTWNEELRTQTFSTTNAFDGFYIKVPQNLERRANSLIIAMFVDGKIKQNANIMIPLAGDSLLYYYHFGYNKAAQISVFYLDRIANVEPHKFMFCYSNSQNSK